MWDWDRERVRLESSDLFMDGHAIRVGHGALKRPLDGMSRMTKRVVVAS